MNQHFVPRTYLKNFAEKKGKEFYVDVFDLKKQIQFNTNINNICAERDLYTLGAKTEVATDALVVEKIYGIGLEPMFTKAYSLLIDDGVKEINNAQRVEILLGVFQLYMRNPRILTGWIAHHTSQVKALVLEALEKNVRGITYLDENFSFRDWTEQGIINHFEELVTKIYKEQHVIGIGEIGEFHKDARLEVIKIRGESLFFTSDNPLITDDYSNRDHNPLSKTQEFKIPLNLHYHLRIYHDNTIPRNIINRTGMGSADVAITNGSMIGLTTRFIIGSKRSFEDYFRIIKAMNESPSKVIIDVMRQVVDNIPAKTDDPNFHELMVEHLKTYDEKGFLTKEEEEYFHSKMLEHARKRKNDKI
jgi:hypothetical protein